MITSLPYTANNCSEITWVDRQGLTTKLMGGFFVLFCGQVGYIQLGSEQLLIQPVNASETSFSGKEHFIRRRRSTKPSTPTRPHGPEEHCKVVAGELGVAPESSHGNSVWIL